MAKQTSVNNQSRDHLNKGDGIVIKTAFRKSVPLFSNSSDSPIFERKPSIGMGSRPAPSFFEMAGGTYDCVAKSSSPSSNQSEDEPSFVKTHKNEKRNSVLMHGLVDQQKRDRSDSFADMAKALQKQTSFENNGSNLLEQDSSQVDEATKAFADKLIVDENDPLL